MNSFSQKQRETKFPGGAKRGQVFVLSALSMVVLMGFAAVAIDVGSLWNTKRQMQTAADAAAVAGARELKNGNDAVAAAKLDASQNGFADDSNGIDVTVNNPPTSGGYMGDNTAVETIISQSRPTFFMKVLKINSVQVSARAVARSGKSSGCVWIMNPSASKALTLSGSGSITSSCSVMVNSNNSDAMDLSGSACISGGASVSIVGNYVNHSSCVLNPVPTTGVATLSDPFGNVPAPSTQGGCTYNNLSVHGTQTLNPGKYCGGITVSGGSTAVLNPGMYILAGGGLVVTGGSNITGTGVTFYNTNGQGGGGAQYGPIVVSGSNANLSAPTSGTYVGMLFFEDRSITSTAQNTIASNTSNAQFNGAVYFLHSPLVWSGGSNNTPSSTQIVADTLTISGPSYVGGSSSGAFVADSVVLGE